MTTKFAGVSNIPFILIQLPQGMLNGLLGNLTLLYFFTKKKEIEAIMVQTLGVMSIYVVTMHLAVSGAAPLPHFMAISAIAASRLVLNFVDYINWLSQGMSLLWKDFITITRLSVLPQVMWSTFVSIHPKQYFAGNYLLHHGSWSCHYGMVATLLPLSMLFMTILKLVGFLGY